MSHPSRFKIFNLSNKLLNPMIILCRACRRTPYVLAFIVILETYGETYIEMQAEPYYSQKGRNCAPSLSLKAPNCPLSKNVLFDT